MSSQKIKNLSNVEKKNYFKSWYCYKYKSAGLRYEMGVCIYTGNIVWINGPFKPGLYNDKKIFNENLKNVLPPGEYVIADKMYRGDPDKARVPNENLDTPEETFYNQRARARQENTNHLLKQWKILRQIYRHDVSTHVDVFWSVAVLTQISFDLNEKLNYHVDFVGEIMV